MSLRNYIMESSKKTKQYHVFNRISFYVLSDLPDDVDVVSVISDLEDTIPEQLMFNVETIMVGRFDFLLDRGIKASYQDGAIYVLPDQDSDKDMLDDIVHEVAHSIEETSSMELYYDREIENEFIGKRKRLARTLEANGFDISSYNFLNPDHDKKLDEFLWYEVGYPTLLSMTMGLFITPYSSASMREYFAEGFEAFYLDDRDYIKNTSPALYNKLQAIEKALGE